MLKQPRVFIAKGGLDGHDSSAIVVADGLAEAGFEVIYGGLYLSPEEVVYQAFQEDVDIIGISIHSGEHGYFFPRLFELLGRRKRDFIVIAGGIIPLQDKPVLQRLGVRAVFDPGTMVQGEIVPTLTALLRQFPKKERTSEALYRALKRGDSYALARFISMLTNGTVDAHHRLLVGQAVCGGHTVGLSGHGGVGKSSLLARLTELWADQNIGAVCVDPCRVSGGAFLADRVRMNTSKLFLHPNVFVRSLVARDVVHGVSAATPLVCNAMKLAGKEIVFLESVGAGQYDVGFDKLVDTFVYVASPAIGDELQILKGGAIEKAHVIALNHSDEAGAQKTLQQLEFAISLWKNSWHVPVISTNGITGEGVPELWQAVLSHKNFVEGKNA